jgi:hypothetical protein
MLNASNAELWTNERIIAMVRDPLAPVVLHPQRQYGRVEGARVLPDTTDVSPSRSAAALKELKRRHMIHINCDSERGRRQLIDLPGDGSKAATVFNLRGCMLTPQW